MKIFHFIVICAWSCFACAKCGHTAEKADDLHQFKGQPFLASYIDCDHAALTDLKALERESIDGVQFLTPEEVPLNAEYDFAVSDLCFSEFSRPFQKRFCERILAKSRAGYLLGHVFPKHFGVDPFPPSALRKILKP